jgi:hypothetical protein
MSADEPEPVPKTEQSPVLPEPKPESKKKSKSRAREVERVPERPAFLDAFPKDPDLDPLVDAFVRGNYALVRSGASKLAERSTDAPVRDAALELRRRIDPDPLARYILLASIGLLLVLSLIALLSHGGHAH